MRGNVVCHLTQSLPKNVNHKVFFDNFFSTVALMNHLKKDGFWAVATIHNVRLKGADRHLLTEKELKKKGCGSFDYVVETNSGVTVLCWFDNGPVQLLSNYIGNGLATQARCWSKKEGRFISTDRPTMVVEYNSNMGGVDLLLSMYRIHHRSTKYYMHIVFYCIGVAVVNGLLLYRRHMTQKNVPAKNHMSLLSFQSEIAVSLCKAGKTSGETARPRGRPSSTSPVHHPRKGKQHQCQTQTRIYSLTNVVIFQSFKKSSSDVDTAKLVRKRFAIGYTMLASQVSCSRQEKSHLITSCFLIITRNGLNVLCTLQIH